MTTIQNSVRWIDGKTCYRIKTVDYSECKTNKEMSLHALVNAFAEVAHDEGLYTGKDIDFYFEQNMAFMITRNSLKIFRMPVADEVILISTWPKGIEGKVYHRDFEVHNTDGELLCAFHLTSKAVDLLEMKSVEFVEPDSPHLYPLERNADAPECIKIIPESSPVKLGERIIYRSDLDFNNHVNNRIYTKLATDFMPEQYYNKSVREYVLNYNRQTSLNDIVEIFGEERDNAYAVFCMVDGKQHFACEFRYY